MATPPRPAEPGPPPADQHRRIESAITQAGLDDLPSLAAIIDRVAELHGKPIRLEQVGDAEWGTLTGLWVETGHTSRIFVRRTDPVAYQVVCVLHEAMHILLGHPGCLPGPAGPQTPPAARRARAVGGRPASASQAGYEADAEYGARLLAQSLLHGDEDPAERRFG